MNCKICETDEAVVRHHIIPKSRSNGISKTLADQYNITVGCCSDCANQIHQLFTNKELAGKGLEKLLQTEEMRKYIKWKKKHPGDHSYRMSNKVKDWKRYHRGG